MYYNNADGNYYSIEQLEKLYNELKAEETECLPETFDEFIIEGINGNIEEVADDEMYYDSHDDVYIHVDDLKREYDYLLSRGEIKKGFERFVESFGYIAVEEMEGE